MNMTSMSPGTGLLLADNQRVELGALSPLKFSDQGLMISHLLPSVLLNSLWMEIYSKSALALPDGCKPTLLLSRLPGSHRVRCSLHKTKSSLSIKEWTVNLLPCLGETFAFFT